MMWSSLVKRRSSLYLLIVISLILLSIFIHYSSKSIQSKKKSFGIEFPPPLLKNSTTEKTISTGTREPTKTLSENKSTRVCCFILTSPKSHLTRAKAVNNTWGPRCDRYFFISDPPDPKASKEQDEITKTLPIAPIVDITAGYQYLIQKTKSGFLYFYQHHFNDCEWFVKADDDTYLLVENLRTFLSNQDTTQPITFGYNFKVRVLILHLNC